MTCTSSYPRYWISILIKSSNKRFDPRRAEAYAKLGMAVSDAFISCWYTKYKYNLLRPITCINAFIDPNWQPRLTTPPIPEYTSGHSVQSGSAAQVMTDMFGNLAY
jgi:hypothetical protein